MTAAITDPWPKGFGEPRIPTPPIAILRQYGNLLGEKTRNIIVGVVLTEPAEKFIQHFELYCAPLNYRYQLFFVEHGIELYPAELEATGILHQRVTAGNPAELQQHVVDILAAPKTLEIINSLLVQSKA